MLLFSIFSLYINSAFTADSYTINNNTSVDIVELDVCRQISNTSGKTIFIGTKTVAEWKSFATKFVGHPSGVTNSYCACNDIKMNSSAICIENPSCTWSGSCH